LFPPEPETAGTLQNINNAGVLLTVNEADMRFVNRVFSSKWRRLSSYTQGQSPEARIREYFYYIDHQGQV